MKKILLYCVTLLFMGLSFVSCEKSSSQNKLYGKWLLKSTEYGTATETIESNTVEGAVIFQFYSSGKYTITELGQTEGESGNWILSDDELRMVSGNEVMLWTIKELTDSSLILQAEAEKPYYFRYIFSKVK